MEEVTIDDSLYSRQRYVLGDHAMKRMATSSVFLSGLGGLGIEIAKNIVLAGIKNLTIHDSKSATNLDLGTQFYLSKNSLGKNRATESLNQLIQLNPYVNIKVNTDEINDSFDFNYFRNFNCVVVTEMDLALQIKINRFCHENQIKFISSDCKGILSWCFIDFNDEFEVIDSNGEQPVEIMIHDISNEENARVFCLENHFHNLESGEFVKFHDIEGYDELNEKEFEISVVDGNSFTIGLDRRGMNKFQRGKGVASQIKKPKKLKFLSLEESLKTPEFTDRHNNKELFLAFRGLYKYFESFQSFPAPWNSSDASKYLSIVNELNSSSPDSIKLDNFDANSPNYSSLYKAISFTSQGNLVCFTAFMGGVVGQEVLKALSGKFTPIKQWLFIEGAEILDKNLLESWKGDEKQVLKGDRYDSLRICVTDKLVESIANSSLFVIGAGAIGCEMVKNLALLGACRGKDKVIHITDNDLIERSNLNRQFLFRPADIQKPKSTTAAKAAKVMNEDINVEAYLDKVGPQTQDKFSDSFFKSINACINALDNVEARLYMDQRCVTNQKPLLESGTLGPKGHVQVIVPFQSESYASQSDPQTKDIPFCTLKSFPNSIEHCIIYSRDLIFEELFVVAPRDLKLYLDTPDLIEKITNDDVDIGRAVPNVAKLIRNKPNNYEDCIRIARNYFETHYHNSIIQLLTNFPLDHKLSDGSLFWALPRRAPSALKFDSKEKLHLDFIYHFSFLLAELWAISSKIENFDEIARIADSVVVEPFYPKQNMQIETDENAKNPIGKDEKCSENELEDMKKTIISFFNELNDKKTKGEVKSSEDVIRPIEFEKDDDTNHHIDFITAATNLRASNYSIKLGDKLEIKRIAGNITPAIATTTSAVSGLVTFELIKLLSSPPGYPLENYKNAFINLAISLFTFSEPGAAEKKKVTKKLSITVWDRWEVLGWDKFTLQDLFDYFLYKYRLTVKGVVYGSTMIYIPLPMYQKRLPIPLSEQLKKGSVLASTEHESVDIVVNFVDSKSREVPSPAIRYYFKGGNPDSIQKLKDKASRKRKKSSKSDSAKKPKKSKKKEHKK